LAGDGTDILVGDNDVVEPDFRDITGGCVGDVDLVFDKIEFQGGVVAPLEAFEGLPVGIWGPTAPKP